MPITLYDPNKNYPEDQSNENKETWDKKSLKNAFQAQYDFTEKEVVPSISNHKYTIVDAPAKSGKRFIGYTAKCFLENEFKHFYWLTALNRKDTKKEQNEIIKMGFDLSISTKFKNREKFIPKENSFIVIDELDLGSGDKQKLNELFSPLKNKNGNKFLLLSATPEEIKYSDLNQKNLLNYSNFINENYIGAMHFFKEGLAEHAEPPLCFNKEGLLH